MVNYANSMIYKLVCRDVDIKEVYVGSTCNFTRRKQQHKNDCVYESGREYNRYVYRFIRDSGGWVNWDMLVVERCEGIVDKMGLHIRERYWIETFDAKLNKQVPLRTVAEWWDDNKDSRSIYTKQWYVENKESVAEKGFVYRQVNKDKIKQYEMDNAEKIKMRHRKYNKDNAEKINRMSACECGAAVRRYGLPRHKLSPKHSRLMNNVRLSPQSNLIIVDESNNKSSMV